MIGRNVSAFKTINSDITAILKSDATLFMLRSPVVNNYEYMSYHCYGIKSDATIAYQVPTDKFLRIYGIVIHTCVDAAALIVKPRIGYSADAVFASGSPPTGNKDELIGYFDQASNINAPINRDSKIYIPYYAVISAEKYPYFYNDSSDTSKCYSTMICRLVDSTDEI